MIDLVPCVRVLVDPTPEESATELVWATMHYGTVHRYILGATGPDQVDTGEFDAEVREHFTRIWDQIRGLAPL